MKKILLVLCVLFSIQIQAQKISLEFKSVIDGKLKLTGGEDSIFDIQKGIELEANIDIYKLDNIQILIGSSFMTTGIPNHKDGGFRIFSGVVKVEGDFFSDIFQKNKLDIFLFLGFKPGLGLYINNDYDDVHISLGLDAGVKVQYEDFYLCFLNSNIKGIQEPNQALVNNYNQSYLAISLGKDF